MSPEAAAVDENPDVVATVCSHTEDLPHSKAERIDVEALFPVEDLAAETGLSYDKLLDEILSRC
jgi:hypothetical protein